jgi:uncharacterized protein (TIGR04255 family)
MQNSRLKLTNPPIVEAVIDINCDVPVSFDLEALQEPAKARFAITYPKSHRQVVHEQEFRSEGGKAAEFSVRQQLGGSQETWGHSFGSRLLALNYSRGDT